MKTLYFNSHDDFVKEAVTGIIAAAETAIQKKNRFDIVLSGGETPLPVYRELAKQNADWSVWHIWLADERECNPDETVLNWKMIRNTLLDSVPIPVEQLHQIETEKGVHSAALQYDLELQKIDEFDLVILGLGEDGHTASLFPGMDRRDEETPAAFAVLRSPKPPPHRVTLSGSRLCKTKEILFLVSGTAKRNVVTALKKKKDMPASHITGRISTKLLYFQPL